VPSASTREREPLLNPAAATDDLFVWQPHRINKGDQPGETKNAHVPLCSRTGPQAHSRKVARPRPATRRTRQRA